MTRRAVAGGADTPRGRDGAERLLALATVALPPRYAGWGAAMRAELAAIADPDARWCFARSAAAAAFRRGLGIRVVLPLATALVAAGVTLVASRLQLPDGGPGVLSVTVPVPPVLLLAVGVVAAGTARSVRVGLQASALALVACFAAVFTVVATEGLVWMQQRGVFVLDADPPKHPVGSSEVVLDFFATGLWLGHLVFWLPWALVGAALGAWIGAARGGAAGSPRGRVRPQDSPR